MRNETDAQRPDRINSAEQLVDVERTIIKLKKTVRKIAAKMDGLRVIAKEYRERSRIEK